MPQPTCLVAQPTHESGLHLLEAAGWRLLRPASETMEGLEAAIGACQAVITRNLGLSARAIEAGRSLQVIANHGAGLDRVDLARASALGIPVVYTPGANAQAVAEHAILLAMAVARRLVRGHQGVQGGDWSVRYAPGAMELSGKTLGVVGFGAIGRAVARIAAQGFGMRVLVHSPRLDRAELERLSYAAAPSLPALLSGADVVTLHRPAAPGEPPVIDREALRHARPGAILVNTARAGLIDHAALLEALAAGRLAGAGLDVFEQEPLPSHSALLGCEQLVLSPHLGAGTEDALARMSLACAQQILDVVHGRRPAWLANGPVWPVRRGAAPASSPAEGSLA